MLIFKEVFFIFLISILTPNPVFTEVNTWGYPSSNNGENNWNISLELGESWQMSSGKWLRGHLGIDIVMPQGESVYVASDGILEQVFNWPTCEGFVDVCINGRCTPKWMDNRGWGPTVVIKHEYIPHFESKNTYLKNSPAQDEPQVVYTQYGHLDNVSHLSVGQVVKKGERLAGVGKICDWIPHVHFEIKDQDGLESDIAQSDGDAGFGYSGTDNYALYRYIPQEFIDANKNLTPELIIEEELEPITEPAPQKSSLFQRIKSFFSQLFNSTKVEGELRNTTIVPPQNTIEEDETPTQTDIQVTSDVLLFDAEILPIDTIRIGTEDREALITARARNTGNQTWTRSAVSLNVVGGRSANASYRHSSWLTDLRPTRVDQERVLPRDIGTFTLLVRIPETESTITFRAQLVEQTGSRFAQIGTQFVVATIQKEIPAQQEISENSTAETGSVPPPRSGIIRQIQDVIIDVTKNVQESISQTIDTIVDTTQRIIFGGGSSRRVTENNGTEEENGMMPELRVVSPTSSPYIATTSTFELSGIINDVVSQVNVDTTASGTLSFSTTSLTWQWIGELTGGTTTFSVVARAGERASLPAEFTVYYAPQYELTVPIITSPTTESIWYTNVSNVELSGSVDSRASGILYLFDTGSMLPVTSSTWQHIITNTGEGIVTHTYQAIDTFGNISPTTSIDIVYDGTAPLLATSTGMLTSTTLSLVTTATDTLSGIDTYEWQVLIVDTDIDACIDSTSTVPIDSWPTATSCEWGNVLLDNNETVIALPEQLQEQNLVIRARATDRAQNVSDWQLFTVPYIPPATGPTYAAIRNARITEIAWMGTKSSPNDEWIEIVIIGDTAIDVHHWWLVWGSYNEEVGTYEYEVELTYDDMTEDEPLFIPPGYPILFERTDDTTINDIFASFIYTGALSNSGVYMAILNADREIIDELDTASGWFAGNNTTKASMMRRDIVGETNDSSSWCTYTDCTPTDFLWSPPLGEDSLGNPIVGSPGGPVFGEPTIEL